MKNIFIIRPLSFLLLSLLFFNSYAQQSAKITGKVTDKKNGETLIGLTVKVDETTSGASTDMEGRYTLSGLTPGTYAVTFSYIGYQSKNITGIVVEPGKVVNLDVVMEEASGQTLNEVVIKGSFKRESVNALFAQQKNSINISSGISADQIKRSPDKNTSDVLKRVSGASIQDNKFIIVRGLADRYNAAMLNNSMLPNTEVDKRAFSFDILPSNLIDAIVVTKTASADIPADFSGGVVQITTKDFPDATFLNLSLGTSYNTQSAFKDFLSAPKSGKEIFGFYDKGRNIPSSFPSTNAFQSLASSSDERFALSRQFKNNWGYQKAKSVLGPALQLNYGTSKTYENSNKFGTIMSLTYRYDERLKTSNQQAWTGQNLGDQFNDNVYSANTNIGALANFAYSWDNNKISLKNLYNRVLESQFTYREGADESGSLFVRSGDYLLQRSLLSNQLTGEHLLSAVRKIKLDWNLNYAYTDRKEPGYKRMDYDRETGRAAIQSGSAVAALAGNFSSALNENTYGGAVNIAIPVNWFRDNNKIKVGYFGQNRVRDFGARVIGFIRNGGGDFDTSLLNLPQNQLFDPGNIRPKGFVLDEITNGGDKYDANSMLNAGYAMFDGYLTEKLRFGVGARLESYNVQLNSVDNSVAVNLDSTAVTLLPSANLIYNLNDKASLRLAGSQTVGRPEFRELAPFSFYDFNKNVSMRGNQYLKQSKTTNVDLGYAFYPSSGEVISVNAFYKYFELPIEQQLLPVSSGRAFTYGNAQSATLYGLEIELRKSLKFIDERFNKFIFSTNASLMKSEVLVPKTVNVNGKRPMQGQSPYLINAGLQYNSATSNATAISLLYNRIGRRIWAIGNSDDPDIYENPRNVLDFQIAQKFAGSRAEVKLNYSDILNNNAIFYQKVKNATGDYNSKTDRLNIADRFGATVSLGLTYNFY
ncbi:MAG: TonB-dependent receptor domain-containing protein [Sphingobacteriaceae bacterium]